MRDATPYTPDLEGYARAAALAAGLSIDDAWWPGVVRHLSVILERAASLDGSDDNAGEPALLPDDPAPVFVA